MKLVVDTSTLISGSLWQGPPAQLLEEAARGKVELVLSPELLAEFAAVVARPKFSARVAARATTPDDLTWKLAEEVTIISDTWLPLPPALRDPKDLHVLECAVAAQADAIVSGDEDLLTLVSFGQTHHQCKGGFAADWSWRRVVTLASKTTITPGTCPRGGVE